MEFIPIKTRIIKPNDDIISIISESIGEIDIRIKNKDILILSSGILLY